MNCNRVDRGSRVELKGLVEDPGLKGTELVEDPWNGKRNGRGSKVEEIQINRGSRVVRNTVNRGSRVEGNRISRESRVEGNMVERGWRGRR